MVVTGAGITIVATSTTIAISAAIAITATIAITASPAGGNERPTGLNGFLPLLKPRPDASRLVTPPAGSFFSSRHLSPLPRRRVYWSVARFIWRSNLILNNKTR